MNGNFFGGGSGCDCMLWILILLCCCGGCGGGFARDFCKYYCCKFHGAVIEYMSRLVTMPYAGHNHDSI